MRPQGAFPDGLPDCQRGRRVGEEGRGRRRAREEGRGGGQGRTFCHPKAPIVPRFAFWGHANLRSSLCAVIVNPKLARRSVEEFIPAGLLDSWNVLCSWQPAKASTWSCRLKILSSHCRNSCSGEPTSDTLLSACVCPLCIFPQRVHRETMCHAFGDLTLSSGSVPSVHAPTLLPPAPPCRHTCSVISFEDSLQFVRC